MNPNATSSRETTESAVSESQSEESAAVAKISSRVAKSVAQKSTAHLDENGRPLYMTENAKGSSGQNRWMWENAKLIMPSREETKSSNCLGAWCLKCECTLNYHPTRNFKAISRHFKRHHLDLQLQGDSQKKVAADKRPPPAAKSNSSRPCKRIKIALSPSDAIPRSQILLDRKGLRVHRITSPPAFHPCGEGRLVVVTEHMVPVPLYRSTNKGSLDIYFTVVEKVTASNRKLLEDMVDMAPDQRAAEYVEDAGLANADDMMLFLQGGPGLGCPTPAVSLGFGPHSSWAASALDHYSRIVLMDQRGTGRSSPVTKQSLQKLFPDLFLLDPLVESPSQSLEELGSSNPDEAKKVENSVAAATEFLAQFRADNIVQDAEAVKDALLQKDTTCEKPWGCGLGQSFGGFCMMTYLSKVERPPSVCLLTGGIGPMLTPAYKAYSSLWHRVKERNMRYYSMYPGDIPIVKLIVKTLLEEPVTLPSGGMLTARRFLQTGIALGGGPNAFATVHELLSGALLDTDEEEVEFKLSFLKRMDSFQNYDENPFYFWLHESIYADGPNSSHVAWAAHRAYEDIVKSQKEFDYQYTCFLEDNSTPTLFFGEMVFPWMPDDYEELSGVGIKALAHALASKNDWEALYDGDRMRKVLNNGSSRAAAAVYYDDLYVDFNASMKVIAPGAPLESCKVWVTNEYQHSGIKDDGARIFAKLHGMACGTICVPS